MAVKAIKVTSLFLICLIKIDSISNACVTNEVVSSDLLLKTTKTKNANDNKFGSTLIVNSLSQNHLESIFYILSAKRLIKT
jgi:hypothetical protein